MKGAVLAVLIAGGILGAQYFGEKASAQEQAKWDVLRAAIATNDAAELGKAAEELAGTGISGWAHASQATVAAHDRSYDEALEAVAAVESDGSKWLTQVSFPITEDGPQETIASYLKRAVAGTKAFDDANPNVFKNASAPEGSPRVRIETSAGNIVVALYEEEAPKHVENFLKHVNEDYYVGTKFHRVMKGFMIQGGDPNTKEGEIDTWGQGGPEYKIDREQNDLSHGRGVLSAAKQPQEFQSSGSQFFITVDTAYHLDGQHVIYGEVLEGMDVVDEIVAGEVREPTATVQNVPVNPVEITKVAVIE
ncbi:MAG: peptidylprolyl isomerase [bacterium]|nr:peptidylprolyl isomerase [bacterium]